MRHKLHELPSLAEKTYQLFTFSSLMYLLLPKDNPFLRTSMTAPLLPMIQIKKNKLTFMFPIMPLPKLHKWLCSA